MTKFLHFNVEEQTRPMSQRMRKKFQSRTLAVEPLSADAIKQVASDYLALQSGNDLTVSLKIGVTLCSLKDRYCKAQGRKESLEKQVVADVSVRGLIVNDTHIFIKLAAYRGVVMNLRLNKKSGFVTVTAGEFVGG